MPTHQSFPLVFLLVASGAFAQLSDPNRFTEELTRALESESVNVLITGTSFQIALKLCERLPGHEAIELESEVRNWRDRNRLYVSEAYAAIGAFADRLGTIQGESAKESYLSGVHQGVAKAAGRRTTLQLDGYSVENDRPPPVNFCTGLTKWLRDGAGDFAASPERTLNLSKYMLSRKK